MEHWSCHWNWASKAVRIVKIPHLNNVQLHFHIKPLHFQPQFIYELGDNRFYLKMGEFQTAGPVLICPCWH